MNNYKSTANGYRISFDINLLLSSFIHSSEVRLNKHKREIIRSRKYIKVVGTKDIKSCIRCRFEDSNFQLKQKRIFSDNFGLKYRVDKTAHKRTHVQIKIHKISVHKITELYL